MRQTVIDAYLSSHHHRARMNVIRWSQIEVLLHKIGDEVKRITNEIISEIQSKWKIDENFSSPIHRELFSTYICARIDYGAQFLGLPFVTICYHLVAEIFIVNLIKSICYSQ